MGLRFRKSINLGGGLKINLSQSGVGYSWGTKGVRVSKSANGTVRKTISVPGTGISYVDTSSSKKNTNPKTTLTKFGSNSGVSKTTNKNEKIQSFQLVNTAHLSEDDDLTKSINKVRTINNIATFCLCTIILIPIGLLLKILVATIWKTKLDYEMDEINQNKYDSISTFVKTLSKNRNVWQVIAKSTSTVIKEKITFEYRLPWFIESNVNIYCLKFPKERVYFLPDRILVKKNFGKFESKTYNNIEALFETIKYPETSYVSTDTQIDSYTWQYVNKNGEQDKRYKNNPKMPLCLYGEISITTMDGLNMVIHTSNIKLLPEIQKSFEDFINYNNEIEDNVLTDSDGLDKWNNYNDEYES